MKFFQIDKNEHIAYLPEYLNISFVGYAVYILIQLIFLGFSIKNTITKSGLIN